MKLYHGSVHKLETLKRQQARMVEGVSVPEAELQNKIYFSPDLGFAIAMAAGPDGITSLHNGNISFEHYEQFEPDRPVYVYEIDTAVILPQAIETVDADQVAIDMDEITPTAVHEFVARDVFQYYPLTTWKHPSVRT